MASNSRFFMSFLSCLYDLDVGLGLVDALFHFHVCRPTFCPKSWSLSLWYPWPSLPPRRQQSCPQSVLGIRNDAFGERFVHPLGVHGGLPQSQIVPFSLLAILGTIRKGGLFLFAPRCEPLVVVVVVVAKNQLFAFHDAHLFAGLFWIASFMLLKADGMTITASMLVSSTARVLWFLLGHEESLSAYVQYSTPICALPLRDLSSSKPFRHFELRTFGCVGLVCLHACVILFYCGMYGTLEN